MAEIINVLADIPARDSLVVVAAGFQIPHATRFIDEQSADLLLNAEVNHLAGSLVTHVAKAPLGQKAALAPHALKPLPPPRFTITLGSLSSDLRELLRQQALVLRIPRPETIRAAPVSATTAP
jgi:hypothetical protein